MSIIGCLAVPIIVLLALALVGFGFGAIGQGIAAASLGLTSIVQSIMLPVLLVAGAALGGAAGIGWALAWPRIQQLRRGQEQLPPPETQALPAQRIEIKQLPAPALRHRKPVSRKRRLPINLDRF